MRLGMLDSSDLKQEADIARWQNSERGPAYAAACARNSRLMAQRKAATYDRYIGVLDPIETQDGQLEVDEYLPSYGPGTEQQAISRVMLDGWARKLSERAASVMLALSSGLSQAEVARTLGLSQMQVSRATNEIRSVCSQ